MSTPDLSRAVWHRSRYSYENGECVEVARNVPGVVAVRDSKVPARPALVLTPAAFGAFLRGVTEDGFTRP
ncbi:DUF397 domain-containing protein [Streptomyces sp. B1866]|uniref:DUF397 domain-containing protein n=1 Tax=Streptomyces sp. B1866 TaxID=3075431 RepID=UPI0028922D68|nr:DUF397 domain-containing protein [Streptomyces sp. B1866]MDT3396208.1 DUF397 domain-containing protein [Streptomyces sp. B1866]